MFLNLKKNQHAKFEPSNFKIGWLRVVQSLDALHRVSPKSNNNNLWMLVKPWSFEIKGSNFKCIAFLTIQNFFVFGPRKLPANWRNPRPHLTAADTDLRGHEIQKFSIWKKILTEKKIISLSSVLIVLELFYIGVN